MKSVEDQSIYMDKGDLPKICIIEDINKKPVGCHWGEVMSNIHKSMAFLKESVQARIGNIEWPAYLDIMEQTKTNFQIVPFTKENNFHPSNDEYFDRAGLNAKTRLMPIISNPQNPSGQTRWGDELENLIQLAEQPKNGILLDEAYEMFHSPSVSGIQYVQDLDRSNVFIAGACTKGLQSPGIRVGWSHVTENTTL